jgi:hypothetical protein
MRKCYPADVMVLDCFAAYVLVAESISHAPAQTTSDLRKPTQPICPVSTCPQPASHQQNPKIFKTRERDFFAKSHH